MKRVIECAGCKREFDWRSNIKKDLDDRLNYACSDCSGEKLFSFRKYSDYLDETWKLSCI